MRLRGWVWAAVLQAMAAPDGLATTCIIHRPILACEMYHTTPVIVRARVIDTTRRYTGHLPLFAISRLAVVEAFKGLPRNTREILVGPTDGYEPGKEYLLYLGAGSPGDEVVNHFYGLQPRPKLPAEWAPESLRALLYFGVGACSEDRVISNADTDADILFFRAASRIRPSDPGWIEGRVVQNFDLVSRLANLPAAPGVTIDIQPHPERSFAGGSQIAVPATGTYRTALLPPGQYVLQFASRLLGKGTPIRGEEPVTVHPGGCTVVNAWFETLATIDGRVLGADGKPTGGVRVELGAVAANGAIRRVPNVWANSAADGRFHLERVPLGFFLVGANIDGVPRASEPFDPVYAPGTQDRTRARLFEVKPKSQIRDVELRMSPPVPLGSLHVDVLWPDGTPATNIPRVEALIGTRRASLADAHDDGNTIKLHLALGRTYRLLGSWLAPAPDPFIHLPWTTGPTIRFTRDGQRAVIRLKDAKPRPRE
ncbi:MAG: hypothetical protein IT162_13290 [Bryobacterales bacterium]|nr:hypothetical protein [Bryobacterales bacterium]